MVDGYCCTLPRNSEPSCRPTQRLALNACLGCLADGQRTLPWRRVRPLLRLRADQDRVRHRSFCDGGEAPARRSRSAAGTDRVSRRLRLYDRRHGSGLVKGLSTGRTNSCKCKNTQMPSAGPTQSLSALPRSEGARSTAPGASHQISCTSVMTAATSKQRRRNSRSRFDIVETVVTHRDSGVAERPAHHAAGLSIVPSTKAGCDNSHKQPYLYCGRTSPNPYFD